MVDIEEHMRQANAEGKFNNLPGKGKPLHLEDVTHEDPEWRLAYHILRNAGYTLPWIESRQALEVEIEAARADLQRAWDWHQNPGKSGLGAAEIEAEWRRARKLFEQRLAAINKKIFSYNVEAPNPQFHLSPLVLEKELAAVQK